MKAISLWQPWASAVALGSKRVETRSWSTSYRGPLAWLLENIRPLKVPLPWKGKQRIFEVPDNFIQEKL